MSERDVTRGPCCRAARRWPGWWPSGCHWRRWPARPRPARWSSPGSTSRRRSPAPPDEVADAAGLGGGRRPADLEREVLHRPALRTLADARRAWLAPGRRRPGAAAPGPHPRRAARPPAPGGHLHAGVLGQPRLSLLHRRHRHRPLGRHPARPAAARGRTAAQRHGGGLLGRRRRSRAGRRPDRHRAVRAQHVAGGRAGPERPAVLRDERGAAAPGPRLPGAAARAGLVRGGQRQVAGAHRGAGHAL